MTNIKNIPSPEEFFGFAPGSDGHMIRWDKLCEYYYLIDEKSDRIKLELAGKSSEGNPFLILYISSAENIERLERYREISMQLSDPRGLKEDEINALCEEGKAVCFQSYGLHSNEVGGPQSVPQMLYSLLTAESGELKEVLDNVIFIVSPCSEPDGEIIFTDYYNKYKGTEFDGMYSPYLRHNWAGHSNNRDAIRESLVETKYLNDIMIRGWMPQIFQDHHHQEPFRNRMSIAPNCDPAYEPYCPLIQRETAIYGSEMAIALSAAGCRGIASGDKIFNDFPITTFYGTARLHNIAGMLTESADVKIASPTYIHKDEIIGITEPCHNCPDPWEGGEWHLSDIVKQINIASLSLLAYAAKNKKRVLKLMAQKALYQTERGKNSDKKAYLIPMEQHDISSVYELLRLIKNQNVDIYQLSEDIICGGRIFKKGTAVVPLSQPKYAVIEAILSETPYPKGERVMDAAGLPQITDAASICLTLCMGVEAVPAMQVLNENVLMPLDMKKPTSDFPMPAEQNESYRRANELMAEGARLTRNENGDFCNDTSGTEIKRKSIGLLKKSVTSNEEEGYTRNLLRMYGFNYRIVMDKEIREGGVPEDVDVLIIPGDRPEHLEKGDIPEPKHPPAEYHTGLGTNGAIALKEFVEKGGRLIVWEHTCEYINSVFELKLKNKVKGLSEAEYATYGSQLYVKVKSDLLTLGMPEKFTVAHTNGPVLIPTDINGDIEIIGRICKDKVVANGCVNGEEYLEGTPCIMRVKSGRGEIIMYTFNPEYRVQQNGTFKLLFNELF